MEIRRGKKSNPEQYKNIKINCRPTIKRVAVKQLMAVHSIKRKQDSHNKNDNVLIACANTDVSTWLWDALMKKKKLIAKRILFVELSYFLR